MFLAIEKLWVFLIIIFLVRFVSVGWNTNDKKQIILFYGTEQFAHSYSV